MLKEIAPEKRLSEIDSHNFRLEPFVSFGTFACLLVLFVLLRQEVPNWWTLICFLIFWLASVVLSGLLAMLIWSPLVIWLGRMSLKQAAQAISDPEGHPSAVQEFLESWWKNEFVLDVFVVAF